MSQNTQFNTIDEMNAFRKKNDLKSISGPAGGVTNKDEIDAVISRNKEKENRAKFNYDAARQRLDELKQTYDKMQSTYNQNIDKTSGSTTGGYNFGGLSDKMPRSTPPLPKSAKYNEPKLEPIPQEKRDKFTLTGNNTPGGGGNNRRDTRTLYVDGRMGNIPAHGYNANDVAQALTGTWRDSSLLGRAHELTTLQLDNVADSRNLLNGEYKVTNPIDGKVNATRAKYTDAVTYAALTISKIGNYVETQLGGNISGQPNKIKDAYRIYKQYIAAADPRNNVIAIQQSDSGHFFLTPGEAASGYAAEDKKKPLYNTTSYVEFEPQYKYNPLTNQVEELKFNYKMKAGSLNAVNGLGEIAQWLEYDNPHVKDYYRKDGIRGESIDINISEEKRRQKEGLGLSLFGMFFVPNSPGDIMNAAANTINSGIDGRKLLKSGNRYTLGEPGWMRSVFDNQANTANMTSGIPTTGYRFQRRGGATNYTSGLLPYFNLNYGATTRDYNE